VELRGHTVLVTGGGSGVGFELARGFVRRGNRVVVAGRDEERLRRAAERIGGGVEVVRADLSVEADLRRLAEEVRERVGGLSVLVNNAAVQLNYDWAVAGPEAIVADVDIEVRTDLMAPMKLTALLLPLLREHPESAVVNLTTGLALAPKKTAAVYCGAKAGLRVFGQALRYGMEDAGTGVRVFEAVLPLVDTAMTEGRGNERLKTSPDRVAEEILRGMEGDRREIRVGAVKALAWLDWIAPPLAKRLMRDGV
jgi:short-subunit dehydrogenase involved in D-alanine esterification of teichoic acids